MVKEFYLIYSFGIFRLILMVCKMVKEIDEMQELVTVIVPIYNSERYLEACIRSIMNQTYKNLEIILIDDGSRDSSLCICYDMQKLDDRIIVISKENSGVSSTRNLGLDNTHGQYVYFCDSDDLVKPTMIATMLKKIKEANVDMACSSYCIIRDNGGMVESNKTPYEEYILDKNEMLSLILSNIDKQYRGYLWNKLFKADYLKTVRFNDKLKICEDEVFCVNYVKNIEKGIFFNEELYQYRDNPTGAENQPFNTNKLTYIDSKEEILENLIKLHVDKQLINSLSNILIYQYCSCFWKVLFSKIDDKNFYIKKFKLGFKKCKPYFCMNDNWSSKMKIVYMVTTPFLKL